MAGEIALDDVPLALRLNDTFHFIRILNPISQQKFHKIFVFSLKIDIYSDSI